MDGEIGVVETSMTTTVPLNLVETGERTYRDIGPIVGLSFSPITGALAGATIDVRGVFIRTGSDIYEDTRNNALSPRRQDGGWLSLFEVGAGWRLEF